MNNRYRTGEAVGWWGNNASKRIEQEQIPQKVRNLLAQKLKSRGKEVYLWNEVVENAPGSLVCSCVKDTTSSPDIACCSCYGTKAIPGYVRFGWETIYFASISSATCVNTYLNTDIKPYRLMLSDGFLTGSIASGALPYSNPHQLDWEFRCDSATIKDANLVVVTFSTDGIIFNPISQINNAGKKPINSGVIYINIMLSRGSIDQRSPEFEIIRLRHMKTCNSNIKILRPQVTELPILMQYGGRYENMAERFWTMPLDFFDRHIQADTPSARIIENSFYQRVHGINSESRFVTTKLSYNEEFGIFTHQSFEPRRAQPKEAYALLVF